ncbi:uncharacterized protein [Arachis hypogaea]|uniref:uncharacterized protein n=1 Tax=Arachis hypogaea TaxID=3818 RepID=UPI003B20CBE7
MPRVVSRSSGSAAAYDPYAWVTDDIRSSPNQMDLEELTEFRQAGYLCGGTDEEANYEAIVPLPRERIYELNFHSPRVPDWIWFYKSMFTQVGVRIPFSDFQMALLNRISVCPSQLHPNSWASIRCFEMVCEYLELPASVDVFLFYFNLTNPSKQGKARKGFLSFRAAQGRKIFSLFEDSYHGFKDKYFKVRPVKGRHPFWLSLEGERLIQTYWSFGAGSNPFVKVSYKRLSAVDKNIANVLLAIFEKNHVNPHLLMGEREAGRSYILEMSATVTGLENLMKTFFEASDDENAEEKGAGKSEGPSGEKEGQGTETSGKQGLGGRVSPTHEEGPADGKATLSPHPDSDVELIHTPKKRKMSSSPEGVLTVMERNFDASKFIDSQLIPGTEEHFHATELSGQARWMYRTLLRGAVIARKAEFELSGMEALRRKLESSVKANNDFKAQVELLQGQLSEMGGKLNAAEEKSSFIAERLKASDETVARLLEREMTLENQLNAAQGLVVALEKEREQAISEAKAAKAEAVDLKKKLKVAKEQGKNAILMTEDALKAQLKIAAPDFEISSIGVFKTIQDGKIVDMPRK